MRHLPRLSRAVLRVRAALAAMFHVEHDEPLLTPAPLPLTTTTRTLKRRGMDISEDSAIPSDRVITTDRIAAFKPAQPMPGIVPGLALDAEMAMDDFTGAAVNWAGLDALDEGLTFMGFPYLAQLTQRPEYRRPSEILAKEMTRRWIRVQASGDEDKTEKVQQIEDELKRISAQDTFQKAAEMDGFFGRAQIFIDVGQMDPGELALPLHVSKRKIIRGSLRGLKVIDPIWSYPDAYNSNNPLADDFYKPTSWFIFAQRIHASRLMTLVSRDVPDILKPAYAFGGLSLSQMAKPYIDNWLRTRQSVSDIVHNFSVSVLQTNMSGVMNRGGARQMVLRARLFNQSRDNQGLVMLDKETEDFKNVATPLGGLDHLQAQSQEQMSAVTGIPLVILLGITPSGLNSSSEGELNAFYAWVEAQQRTLFGPPLKKLIDIIQLSLFGEIDPSITFMFEPLQVLSETEQATVEKTKIDTDVAAIGAGIIDPLEARTRLAGDEDGPYSSLDLAKAIAPPGGEEGGEAGDPFGGGDDPSDPSDGTGETDPSAPPKPTPGAIKPAAAAPDAAPTKTPRMAGDAWNEGDHQRSASGQFGSGGASTGYKTKAMRASSMSHSAKIHDDHEEAALAHWSASEAAQHDPAAANLHNLEGDRHRRIAQRLRADASPATAQRLENYNQRATHAAGLSLGASTPDEHDEAALAHFGAAEHARNDPKTAQHAEHHDAIGNSHRKVAQGIRRGAGMAGDSRADGTPMTAAGIMFRAPDGTVLLLKRGAGGDHGGEWCFPGGKVEPGETRKQAARREANEEIGDHPEGTLDDIDQTDSADGVDFTTFVQKVSAPFVPTLNHEHTAWAWARPDSLPEPMHPGPRATLTGRTHADAAAEAA